MGKVNQFLAHVVPGVIRPLKVLWNEVIGFIFFVLAMVWIPSTIRLIREFDGRPAALWSVVLAVGWVGLMCYFAISSFLRARKISKS
jgi:hypothetical protein